MDLHTKLHNSLLGFLVMFMSISSNTYSQNIIIKPYLQDIKTNEAIIMWEADNIGRGFIDFGLGPFSMNQTVSSIDNVGNGNTRIHEATINGLIPNTKYYYKVRMQSGSQSNIYHFYTLPLVDAESTVELVAVSDMQRDGGNPSVFKNLVEQGIVVVCDTILENGFNDLEKMVEREGFEPSKA